MPAGRLRGRLGPRTGTPPPRGEPRTGRGFAGHFHAAGKEEFERWCVFVCVFAASNYLWVCVCLNFFDGVYEKS